MAAAGTVSSAGREAPERRTSTPLLPRISIAENPGSALPVASKMRSIGGSPAATSWMLVSCSRGIASARGLHDLRDQRAVPGRRAMVTTSMPRERRRSVPSSPMGPAPRTSAVFGSQEANAALDEIRLAQRFLDHRERLHQNADVRELVRHADDPADILHDRLGHESVQPGDAPLRVVEPLAHIGLTCHAGRAAVRAADGGGDELTGSEVENLRANGFDLAEHLVTEHERCRAGRRRAERAVDQLAIGATDPDLPHAHQHLARTGLIPRDLGQMQTVGLTGMNGDGRLHTRSQLQSWKLLR